MARFRRRRFSRGRRRVGRVSRRRGRSRGSRLLGGGLVGNTIKAVGYGYLRNKVSMALRPLTSKIPTKYADEIGVGIAAIAAKKFMPRLSPIADTVLTVEAYRIGEQMATGAAAGSSATW